MHGDGLFWRLYDHPVDGPVVVCLQWFDVGDYLTDRWIVINDTEDYATEEGAEEALLQVIEIRKKAFATLKRFLMDFEPGYPIDTYDDAVSGLMSILDEAGFEIKQKDT